MKIISTKELQRSIKNDGIGENYKTIESTPCIDIYHDHDWDHGYEDYFGYQGTRREFYWDFKEMLDVLLEYFRVCKVSRVIIAPCHNGTQFRIPLRIYRSKKEKNSWDSFYYLSREMEKFMEKSGLKYGTKNGVEIPSDDIETIGLIMESGFRDVSWFCFYVPERRLVVEISHHFELLVYTAFPRYEFEFFKEIVGRYSDISVRCILKSYAESKEESIIMG